ncbi:hypothetical protein BTHE_1903, partial [Bifidobacterium thermophilum]
SAPSHPTPTANQTGTANQTAKTTGSRPTGPAPHHPTTHQHQTTPTRRPPPTTGQPTPTGPPPTHKPPHQPPHRRPDNDHEQHPWHPPQKHNSPKKRENNQHPPTQPQHTPRSQNSRLTDSSKHRNWWKRAPQPTPHHQGTKRHRRPFPPRNQPSSADSNEHRNMTEADHAPDSTPPETPQNTTPPTTLGGKQHDGRQQNRASVPGSPSQDPGDTRPDTHGPRMMPARPGTEPDRRPLPARPRRPRQSKP